MNPMLVLGLLLLAGFIGERTIHRIRLPAVTGYLVAGLLVGPHVLGLLSRETVSAFSVINGFALALIAFTIGKEFEWRYLRKLGSRVVTVTMAQGLTAFAITTVLVGVASGQWILAVLLGAIATATAPAATLVTLREMGAHGTLTDTVLAVVAIDDALAILVFGLAVPAVRALGGTQSFSLATALGRPILEVVGALLLGGAFGELLVWALRPLRRQSAQVTVQLAAIALCSGVATTFHLSPLLAEMMAGMVLVNSLGGAKRIMDHIDDFAYPVYVAFFVLAGASLHLDYLLKVGWLGALYVVGRTLGKVFGAYAGATLARYPSVVSKYIGLALLPTGGVGIGMMLMVQQRFPELGRTVTALVLGAAIVFALLGPVGVKIAVQAAGEGSAEETTTEVGRTSAGTSGGGDSARGKAKP